mmetsp:Transcript_71916/g.173519  ORF Transcript_71916/g.173519 Transcript_71916/m.173519 type:complete len:235 (+) Transcript_71916:4000-4704(+)
MESRRSPAELRRLEAPEPRRSILERDESAEPRRLEAPEPRRSIPKRVESAEPRRHGGADLRLEGASVPMLLTDWRLAFGLASDWRLATGLASRAGPAEARLGAKPLSCRACRRSACRLSSSSCPATPSLARSLQLDRPHGGAEPLRSPCPLLPSLSVSVRALLGGIHACCCAATWLVPHAGLEHEAMFSAPGSDCPPAASSSGALVLVDVATRSSAPSNAKVTAAPPPVTRRPV